MYVERAYPGNQKPTADEIDIYAASVVNELQEMGFLEAVEVVDSTWIDVAYTWSLPQSKWVEDTMKSLEKFDIYQVGRYARWSFMGIADSMRDGFFAGSALK